MYDELLSSAKPGLIIIMIDQSGSMSDPYGGSQNKAQFAALAVNRVIEEAITACTSGDLIKDRCYMAVIGYGSSVDVLFLDKVSKLAENKKSVSIKKKVSDGAGGLIEVDEIMRVWVNAKADGGTPMTEAFQQAYNGAEKFIGSHPDSFPPVVINITDGAPNSQSTATSEAQKLMQLKTSDGNVIIMNAHIANVAAGKIELPSNSSGFSSDSFATFLFEISSILPESLANKAKEVGFTIQKDSRGFVFNADAEALVKLLNFGSLGGLR